MTKRFKKQHIVPKRYLDRFATEIDGKPIIGTRFIEKNKPLLFKKPTADVGYVKNFYDVSDKEDEKYWEHFFAHKFDSLYGTAMENIISAITLSRNNAIVLSDKDKETLAELMVAQMFREPDSVEHAKQICARILAQAKNELSLVLPGSLQQQPMKQIDNMGKNPKWAKEQFFNHLFKPENFAIYCALLKNGIWVVYVNSCRAELPFVTSDNPVLVEGIGKAEKGLFYNGLANPSTCFFYPLSPTIAVANYQRTGIVGFIADKLDGRKIILDDKKYIMNKNIKIMEQAYHHSFIPQPLYDKIESNGKSAI